MFCVQPYTQLWMWQDLDLMMDGNLIYALCLLLLLQPYD